MEGLSSGDPTFLETCHRWLLFHYHCNECGQSEEACEYGKVCSYGKTAFSHVKTCTREGCAYPKCGLIKNILEHHQSCKDVGCQVCAPVVKYQRARSKPPPPPTQSQPPLLPAQDQTQARMDSPAAPLQFTAPLQPAPQHALGYRLPTGLLLPRPPLLAAMQAMQCQSQHQPQQAYCPQPPSHSLLLFEARHKQQQQLNADLGRSSPTSITSTTSTAGGGSPAASDGSPNSTPTGPGEALAELQMLQLGRQASLQQLQHQAPQPQLPQQPQQQQQSHQQPQAQPYDLQPQFSLQPQQQLQDGHLTQSQTAGAPMTQHFAGASTPAPFPSPNMAPSPGQQYTPQQPLPHASAPERHCWHAVHQQRQQQYLLQPFQSRQEQQQQRPAAATTTAATSYASATALGPYAQVMPYGTLPQHPAAHVFSQPPAASSGAAPLSGPAPFQTSAGMPYGPAAAGYPQYCVSAEQRRSTVYGGSVAATAPTPDELPK